MPKFVLLWTDAAVWLLLLVLVAYAVSVVRSPELAAKWGRVFRNAPALASSLILIICLGVTLLDSVHYRSLLPPAAGVKDAAPAYDSRTRSLLDLMLADLLAARESTYSRPLSYLGFTKESLLVNGQVARVAPRLVFGGAHLANPGADWAGDVAQRAVLGELDVADANVPEEARRAYEAGLQAMSEGQSSYYCPSQCLHTKEPATSDRSTTSASSPDASPPTSP